MIVRVSDTELEVWPATDAVCDVAATPDYVIAFIAFVFGEAYLKKNEAPKGNQPLALGPLMKMTAACVRHMRSCKTLCRPSRLTLYQGRPGALVRSSSNVVDGGRPTRLLLVWHSRTGLARKMADALERGAYAAAKEMEVSAFVVDKRRACEATKDDLLRAHGYLFCAPENLASTSGEMLEFFHSTYYHMFEEQTDSESGGDETSLLLGRPCGVCIAAGSDGSSAARQIERICRGWRLRPVADTIIHRNGLVQTAANILAPKVCSPDVEALCETLGGSVAATLLL